MVQVAETPQWIAAAPLSQLAERGRAVVKLNGRQIALFYDEGRIFACNNRCPHEGYPLVEGTLDRCALTCNWHNWKFDLTNGDTLVGGEPLRTYPTRVDGEDVLVDLADPPAEARIAAALESLHGAFRRLESDRMAREVARLQAAGGDPLAAVAAAIDWTHDRLEYGTTHAYAAAPDWLALRARWAEDEAERLMPVIEILRHANWDSLRQPAHPYPEGTTAYAPDKLVAAIEAEDERAALAQLRGALGAGLGVAELEPALARAALAHYQDFGHSAIYVVKTRDLIERLGRRAETPLLLALVRALVYAYREDRVPAFRSYASALAAWDSHGALRLKAEDFRSLGPKQILPKTLAGSADPQGLYHALLGAAAWNLLHFDTRLQARTDGPISENTGWLSFTHAITFANAGRRLAERSPELWPAVLLQLAFFVGRNTGRMDENLDGAHWAVAEPGRFFRDAYRGLFDHAQQEPIVSAHLIKTLSAAEEELAAAPEAPWAETLLAGVNRFLNSPLKRRHALREARQALSFVELE